MLPIKLSNSNNNFLVFLFVILFFFSSSFGEEKTIDIWNKKSETKSEESKKNTIEEKSKIDISKINQSKKEEIKISENQNENPPVKLIGLYDPGKNDLSLEMWSGTNGEFIRDAMKRIEKIKLSKFSEEIFLNTILTYSYAPKKNLSDSEFYGIINYLESENKIIKISPDLFYSYNTLNEIKDKIIRHFKTTDLLTIPEFKEISQTTRKLAVPLLEYLDKINFTYRSENSRKLSRSYNE